MTACHVPEGETIGFQDENYALLYYNIRVYKTILTIQ